MMINQMKNGLLTLLTVAVRTQNLPERKFLCFWVRQPPANSGAILNVLLTCGAEQKFHRLRKIPAIRAAMSISFVRDGCYRAISQPFLL
jgi:hypothetical protein